MIWIDIFSAISISIAIAIVISIAIAIGVNDQLTFASMLETIPAEFGSGITKFFSRIGL